MESLVHSMASKQFSQPVPGGSFPRVPTDTTGHGSNRALHVGVRAALVHVLGGLVAVSVVADIRQDSRCLVISVKLALAVHRRCTSVESSDVVLGVVPDLVEIDLAIVGPVPAI